MMNGTWMKRIILIYSDQLSSVQSTLSLFYPTTEFPAGKYKQKKNKLPSR